MAKLDEIMSLDIQSFFRYVQSIRYGFRDRSGKLHFAEDKDFSAWEYSFSSPEEIVNNNCCWCWDLAEFIKEYCFRHSVECSSYFMEYLSDDLHQTHTQVFLRYQGKWIAAPDNCLGLQFGSPSFDDLKPCVEWFVCMFTDFLRSVLKEKYDEANLLVKEYTCSFTAGISEEDYLIKIRK